MLKINANGILYFNTHEDAAREADAFNAIEEDWVAEVREMHNGKFAVAIIDEDGEFISYHF